MYALPLVSLLNIGRNICHEDTRYWVIVLMNNIVTAMSTLIALVQRLEIIDTEGWVACWTMDCAKVCGKII